MSCDGDDSNDGKSPETPWKTVKRVNGSWLFEGDAVLFRRGDVFRGWQIIAKAGVTYGAYGTGEKPKFYGHTEDLADPRLWEEYDTKNHIWKYIKKIANPGTLVFDDGTAVARNHIPSFRNLGYVCRYDETKPSVIENELTDDLDLFWYFDRFLSFGESKGEKFPVPDVGGAEKPPTHTGDLYLRCNKGNPGEVFKTIEAVAYQIAFNVSNTPNVTIDNFCIKYYCFAVAGSDATGLHVSNCEIGWIGGNIQSFDGNDPNYPEGKRGSVTRYGNGIEIYGSCHDYMVSNCYIYQSYDAGASHQACIARKKTMTHVRYTDNLIEKCVYGIEYFLDSYNKELGSYMDDIIISGNIIRLSGYGWGQQRHNVDTPALVKGWSYENPASNFSIYNNIFDRSAYRMLHLVARKEESCPKMHDNTYIQHLGGMIGQYGANEVKEPAIEIFDENAEEKILNIFGDKNAKVYVIE
ncbi:MAG: hypothetical protein J6D15_03010 [Clostridia bacterium]|nr:hypothetical protein [Clostridia bacterium]